MSGGVRSPIVYRNDRTLSVRSRARTIHVLAIRPDYKTSKTEENEVTQHYLMRVKFTHGSVKALVTKPADRTNVAKSLIESFGGKLLSYYLAFGEYDVVLIAELPDNAAAVGVAMAATSTGGYTGFETTPLLTAHESEAAMKKAHDTKTDFKPPH